MSEETTVELWELVAREQIRETVARYTHAGDRGLIDELAAQFTPDGVLEIAGGATAEGRQAIIDLLGAGVQRGIETAPEGVKRIVRHNVSNVLITNLTQDRGEVASYFLVATENGPDHWGRYRDVVVPAEGRWLIAHRFVRVDAAAPGSRFH